MIGFLDKHLEPAVNSVWNHTGKETEKMPDILSQDGMLEFDDLLAANTVQEKLLLPEYKISKTPHEFAQSKGKLLFSEIEKQMNMNAAQIQPTHYPTNNNQSHQIRRTQQGEQTQQVFLTQKGASDASIKDEIDVNSVLYARPYPQDLSQITGSYDSSPESNFPYTPVDSLESCTTDSNIDNELAKNIKAELFDDMHILDDRYNVQINTGNENKVTNNPEPLLSDDILDKEIEQIISAPLDVQIDHIYSTDTKSPEVRQLQQKPSKRTYLAANDTRKEDTLDRTKKRKFEQTESSSSAKESQYLKCFSILRANYLSLCNSYNEVLDKLSTVETENESLSKRLKTKENEKEQWKIDKDRFLLEREDMKAMLDGLLHEVSVLRRKERQNKMRSTVGNMMLIKDETN